MSKFVMAGLVPAIHVFLAAMLQDVDARDKPGHDELAALSVGLYAEAGRWARRKEWIWRTARGIRSLGSFHGSKST